MGRVVVANFMSIDGVIQSPLFANEDTGGGFERGGWVPPYSDETVNAFMQETTVSASGLLLGRRSYEILRDAWSQADESEPAVAAMNHMPKYVVASSVVTATWPNSRILADSVPRSIQGLKARFAGDLVVFGSGTLVRCLAEHDLIDEYRILTFPLILGNGKRMFDDRGHFAEFQLTDCVTAPSGVVIATYTRGRGN